MGTGKKIDSVQPGARVPEWGMKVIRSLTHRIKAYEPSYSEEDDEDIPEATMKVGVGKVHVCKNGKKSVRPLKQNRTKKDYSGDESFDRWLESERKTKTGGRKKAQGGNCEDVVQRQGPTAERSQHHVNDTRPWVGEPIGCPQVVDRTSGDGADEEQKQGPTAERSHHPVNDTRPRVGEPIGCPQVVDRTPGESATAESMEDEVENSRTRSEEDGIIGNTEGAVTDDDRRADDAEIRQHWELSGSTPIARMNIADRKRERKARQQARRETAQSAAVAYQELVDKALKGYELFHELPAGSSTSQQAENSSAGLIGWMRYHESMKDKVEKNPGSGTTVITARLADCSFVDDVEFPTLGVKKSVKSCNLITKQDPPTISIVAPASLDGWEEIEITVDSGACDTVLPSKMLAGVPLEETEASRKGEEYEVANGHVIYNEGMKRCIMMTKGSATPKGIIFQVSDVHKPLMSVGSMADAGFECLLGKAGGFLRDEDSGEMIPLMRRGNLYHFKAWVRSADNIPPFGGQE